MVDLVPEFEAREMYEDYLAEMKELDEEPLEFLDWCRGRADRARLI